MACLNLSSGFFIPISWSTAPTANGGMTTVERKPDRITIKRSGQNGEDFEFGDFLYAVFGDLNFVAVLKRNAGGGEIDWSVSLVNTTTSTISRSLLFQVTLPQSQPPPHIAMSPGNGRLAFLFSGSGSLNEVRNMMIVRSDGGDPGGAVLPGPGTVSNLNSNVTAEITATQLVIHHPNEGSNDTTTGPRPIGKLKVVAPNPHDFGEAVLGGPAALATRTGSFTLRNDGTDCLTVSAIGDDPPFTKTGTAPPLPVELEPGEKMTVNALFSPTAAGNNITGSLAVTCNPANGDSSLKCKGKARNAVAKIALSRSAIDFGTIPFPGTRTESFIITNSGEIDLNVTIPAPSGSTAFSWTPSGTSALAAGATRSVDVTFTAPGDVAAPDETITITPSQGTPRQITFSGGGCIPNAVPVLPPSGAIDFGQVERGFRTARFRTVRNDGDGDLLIEAEILPAADPSHAALFGLVLPGGDITDAPATRTYTIFPTKRCGAGSTGIGEAPVAVCFHADAMPGPGPYTAKLEIRVPGVPASTSTHSLSAVITPAVPIDAVLVLDRSGSMEDSVGARTKMEAALAAGKLFVQMLRPDADDRAAIVSFSDGPQVNFDIAPVAGNAAALEAAMSAFGPDGATNIAGGIILALAELNDNLRSPEPPGLKRAIVALTDGKENRCFQIGGSGDWLSITGGDAPKMRRPDNTPQDSEELPVPPTGINVYAVGLGDPADIDGAALEKLSSATNGSFNQVQDLTGADFFLLEKHFTQIFMEVAGQAMIADPFFTIVPGDQHVHEFDIFPGDVSAMVVVYDSPKGRLPFVLISPAGEKISGTSLPPGFGVRFRSTATARFVEVTFPQGEPERYATAAGPRWQVIVAHEGQLCLGDINPVEDPLFVNQALVAPVSPKSAPKSAEVGPGFQPLDCRENQDPVGYGIAIAAGSNLRLQAYVEPGTKLVGDTIRLNAELAEAGLPLNGATVTVTAGHPDNSTSVLVLRDDGASEDGAAADGDYGALFTKATQAGVYQFTFRAEGIHAGCPFVREAHRTKTVYGSLAPPSEGSAQDDDCCRELTSLIKKTRYVLYWLLFLVALAVLILLWLLWFAAT